MTVLLRSFAPSQRLPAPRYRRSSWSDFPLPRAPSCPAVMRSRNRFQRGIRSLISITLSRCQRCSATQTLLLAAAAAASGRSSPYAQALGVRLEVSGLGEQTPQHGDRGAGDGPQVAPDRHGSSSGNGPDRRRRLAARGDKLGLERKGPRGLRARQYCRPCARVRRDRVRARAPPSRPSSRRAQRWSRTDASCGLAHRVDPDSKAKAVPYPQPARLARRVGHADGNLGFAVSRYISWSESTLPPKSSTGVRLISR
jgi:hypothetical protein